MSRADHHPRARSRYADEDIEYDRRSARPPPDFLREDYGRNPNAGPMVLREKDKSVIEDDYSSRGSERFIDDRRRSIGDRRVRDGERRRVEEDEVLITRPRRRAASRPREKEADDRMEILYRERKNGRRESLDIETRHEDVPHKARRESSPPALARERQEWVFAPRRTEKEQIVIRERDRAPAAPAPPPPRDDFREEIDIRHIERESRRPPRSTYHEDDIRLTERDGRGYREEEIDIRERDRPAPSPPRSAWDEEIILRQRERDRPRARFSDEDIRIRERSAPGYRDEEIDIRDRSRPAPSRGSWDEEIDIREREKSRRGYREEDIDIRERDHERSRPPPGSYRENDIRIRDRSRPGFRDQEINISNRDRERERPPPPPSTYRDEEIDIRERDGRGGRSEEIDIRERSRTRRPPARTYSDDEIDIRERDRHGGRDEELRIRQRSRSRKPAAERERELVIRRNSSPGPGPEEPIRRRRSSSPREQEELVIKREQSRTGRREEIIIRRDKSRSPSPLPSPSPSPPPAREPSPPPPPEPQVIHAPAIHQEVITHHRHIDHGFEITRPEPRYEPRPASPPPAPRTVYDEEIDIHRSGERNGRRYNENLEIDRKIREAPEQSRARTPALEPRPRERSPPARPKSSLEVDIRRRGERNGEYYDEDIRLMDGVRSSRGLGARERERTELIRGSGKRYVGGRPVEDRMWTEVTKDLVVREALEGCGYEVEETEHYFYIMEYLRYEDVSRLVSISEKIRRDRKGRIRQMEREQRRASPVPSPIPRPALAERPWDEERIYERDVYYDKARRPRPPPAPRPLPAPQRETEDIKVTIR